MERTVLIVLALMVAAEAVLSHRATLSLSRSIKAGFDGLGSEATRFKAEPDPAIREDISASLAATQCIDAEVLVDVVQQAVASAHTDHPEHPSTTVQTAGTYDSQYEMAIIRDLTTQADAILLSAIESGVWSLQSADIFYHAIEQLPEDIRFDYYVKQSAALNSGKISLPEGSDPFLLLR